MSRKMICLLSLVLTLGLLSTGYSDVVYDFETGTQGWGGLKDGTAPTVSPEVHSAGGKQSLRVTIDEAAHGQQEGGWSSPRDFTVNQANLAAGGFTTLSFWYRIDNPKFNGGNFVCHWISSTESWSGGGWYGNGLWGVVIADGQWHQQTFDLSILGQAAGGWQGTWGDLASWEFRDDLRYSIEIAVSPTDKTTGSNMYLDDVKLSGGTTPLPAGVVMIGDFEGGLDNWKAAWEGSPVLANATNGVTSGAGSLSLTTTGGYYCLQWNAPTVPKTLAGTKLQFDLTMVASEWPVGLWTKVADKVALNSNGTSGWKEFTGATVVDKLTGATASADWGRWWDAAPDVQKTYTIDISNYDVTGATWFQINISVQGGNGTGHFYFDNVQLISPPPPSGKSTDTVIGNWEQSMDGWVSGGGADVRYSDTNGVTLGKYSLDVWVPTGAWATVLSMDLLDPNNAAVLAAFRANTKFTADITHKVADWPVDKIPPWNGTHLIINTDAGYLDLGYRAGWTRNDGDRTDSVTWDYSQQLSRIDFSKVTYLQLFLIVNANSPDYTGWVWFYIDNMKLTGGGIALNPKPAPGAVDVPIDSKLSWTAGPYATKHHVYFGTDNAKVRDANKASDPAVKFAELTGTNFDPNVMAFKTQYFWRVDEVNEANPDSPWKGPVWSFTSANFIVVDDFESYNDIDPPNAASHRIFESWSDGFGTTTNGALVGNVFPPYTEQTVVHSGAQAMPLFYDNTRTAVQSETQRVWAVPQDWTIRGFNALKLYIHGSPSNIAGQVYVIVADSAGASTKVTNANTAITTADAWTEWVLSLDAIKAAGVNTAAVTKLVVGVANLSGQPKASGLLDIDDIRVAFQPIGLVAYYALENNVLDSSGNGHDGVLSGNAAFPATYVAGPAGFGKGMLFDGTAGHQNVEVGTFDPSEKTGQLTVALWAKWDGASGEWQGLIGKRDGWALSNMMWHIEVNRDSNTIGFASYGVYPDSGGAKLPIGVWTHVAVAFDGTTARFYINGAETGNGGFSFSQNKNSRVHFGSDDPDGGNPFNGALDEVRIYDIVLSQADIAKLAGK
jgi:hypothetical protein